jgi:zinc transporter ZupT
MLQSLGWAALGTGFTFLMTALGAAMVFFFAGEPRPHFQKTLLGFAAGVMTAASVWSLLLPAIDRAAEGALPDWLPAAGELAEGRSNYDRDRVACFDERVMADTLLAEGVYGTFANSFLIVAGQEG